MAQLLHVLLAQDLSPSTSENSWFRLVAMVARPATSCASTLWLAPTGICPSAQAAATQLLLPTRRPRPEVCHRFMILPLQLPGWRRLLTKEIWPTHQPDSSAQSDPARGLRQLIILGLLCSRWLHQIANSSFIHLPFNVGYTLPRDSHSSSPLQGYVPQENQRGEFPEQGPPKHNGALLGVRRGPADAVGPLVAVSELSPTASG
jgi:hypothetical protein